MTTATEATIWPTSGAKLAAALVEFQGMVTTIPKNRTAKIGVYSYDYADLSDTWTTIRKPLKAAGLAVTQMLTGGESGWMRLETTVWHVSGESMSGTVDIQTGGRKPQEIGSQITYLKRYTLSAVLGLDTDADDDAGMASRSVAAPAAAPEEDPVAVAELAAADKARDELQERLEPYGFTWDRLVKELWERKRKNLKNTRDVALIVAFGDELVAEHHQPAQDTEQPVHDETGALVDPPAQTGDYLITSVEGTIGEDLPGPGAPDDGVKLISEAQLRKLHVLLSKEKISTHDDRVSWVADHIGVRVTSTKQLTAEQASRCIDKLEGN